MDKPKTDINSLFNEAKERETFLKICAPMVRYSKLQFRNLIKAYSIDLCFTPMILADSFCRSSKARLNEFSTNNLDTPVIVQFAAKTVHDFVGASELVFPYSDGVDLNCGCPQRWAMKDGYGCSLLDEPDTIHSLVRNFKNNLPSSFSVSVKIRLLKELKQTIELCRRLENCGINFLTIHGRKSWQKTSDPVDTAALKDIKKSLRIPVVSNGNVKTLEDAESMYCETKCDGVMCAQGMLTNPAMFTGAHITPIECVQRWLNICEMQKDIMSFQCFHHHLVFMLEKTLTKQQKRIFNYLSSREDVYTFLEETFDIKPEKWDSFRKEIDCVYESKDYDTLRRHYRDDVQGPISLGEGCNYDTTSSEGKYFKSVILSEEVCDLDNMESSIFNEN